MILMEVNEHSLLKGPQLITSALKPHNMQKYCEFREQNDVQLPSVES